MAVAVRAAGQGVEGSEHGHGGLGVEASKTCSSNQSKEESIWEPLQARAPWQGAAADARVQVTQSALGGRKYCAQPWGKARE
jgi:hypothetical protein